MRRRNSHDTAQNPGAKKGSQYLMTTARGAAAARSRYVRHQLSGDQGTKRGWFGWSSQAAVCPSCALPGNRKPGYWRRNEAQKTSCPRATRARASRP